MSDLGGVFDANTVAPSTGSGDPIPNGDYVVAMTASTHKDTKNGSGLSCEYTVLDGPHKGRKVFDFLNLQNTSEQAQAIAQGTLSAICHATGVLKTSNSQDFYNLPMLVHVKVTGKREDKATGKVYDEGNKITKYAKLLGGAPSSTVTITSATGRRPSWAGQKSA